MAGRASCFQESHVSKGDRSALGDLDHHATVPTSAAPCDCSHRDERPTRWNVRSQLEQGKEGKLCSVRAARRAFIDSMAYRRTSALSTLDKALLSTRIDTSCLCRVDAPSHRPLHLKTKIDFKGLAAECSFGGSQSRHADAHTPSFSRLNNARTDRRHPLPFLQGI